MHYAMAVTPGQGPSAQRVEHLNRSLRTVH